MGKIVRLSESQFKKLMEYSTKENVIKEGYWKDLWSDIKDSWKNGYTPMTAQDYRNVLEKNQKLENDNNTLAQDYEKLLGYYTALSQGYNAILSTNEQLNKELKWYKESYQGMEGARDFYMNQYNTSNDRADKHSKESKYNLGAKNNAVGEARMWKQKYDDLKYMYDMLSKKVQNIESSGYYSQDSNSANDEFGDSDNFEEPNLGYPKVIDNQDEYDNEESDWTDDEWSDVMSNFGNRPTQDTNQNVNNINEAIKSNDYIAGLQYIFHNSNSNEEALESLSQQPKNKRYWNNVSKELNKLIEEPVKSTNNTGDNVSKAKILKWASDDGKDIDTYIINSIYSLFSNKSKIKISRDDFKAQTGGEKGETSDKRNILADKKDLNNKFNGIKVVDLDVYAEILWSNYPNNENVDELDFRNRVIELFNEGTDSSSYFEMLKNKYLAENGTDPNDTREHHEGDIEKQFNMPYKEYLEWRKNGILDALRTTNTREEFLNKIKEFELGESNATPNQGEEEMPFSPMNDDDVNQVFGEPTEKPKPVEEPKPEETQPVQKKTKEPVSKEDSLKKDKREALNAKSRICNLLNISQDIPSSEWTNYLKNADPKKLKTIQTLVTKYNKLQDKIKKNEEKLSTEKPKKVKKEKTPEVKQEEKPVEEPKKEEAKVNPNEAKINKLRNKKEMSENKRSEITSKIRKLLEMPDDKPQSDMTKYLKLAPKDVKDKVKKLNDKYKEYSQEMRKCDNEIAELSKQVDENKIFINNIITETLKNYFNIL